MSRATPIEQAGLSESPPNQVLAWLGDRGGLPRQDIAESLSVDLSTISRWVANISDKIKMAD